MGESGRGAVLNVELPAHEDSRIRNISTVCAEPRMVPTGAGANSLQIDESMWEEGELPDRGERACTHSSFAHTVVPTSLFVWN